MAKQAGIFRISGTLGGLTFYRMNGRDYVRLKSSLDGKRVAADPSFARSRVCASRFGQASRIAKHLYRHLSPYKKQRHTIGRLTAAAARLLQQGYGLPAAYEQLANRYLGPSASMLLQVASCTSYSPVSRYLVKVVSEPLLSTSVCLRAAPA